MSLFDVIKHAGDDIDIENPYGLAKLPYSVGDEWHWIVTDYVCNVADIAINDALSKLSPEVHTQECVNLGILSFLVYYTRKFMNGEVTIASLADTKEKLLSNNIHDHKLKLLVKSVCNTALRFEWADEEDRRHGSSIYYALKWPFYVYEDLGDADKRRDICLKMYKEWLLKEMLAYDEK